MENCAFDWCPELAWVDGDEAYLVIVRECVVAEGRSRKLVEGHVREASHLCNVYTDPSLRSSRKKIYCSVLMCMHLCLLSRDTATTQAFIDVPWWSLRAAIERTIAGYLTYEHESPSNPNGLLSHSSERSPYLAVNNL